MKKLFASMGILIIFSVGCGHVESNQSAVPTPNPVALATAVPTSVPNVIEKDIMVGDKSVSSGDGKALFQRSKKQKSRKVVHQFKKGLFIGGEK
jgi:hypothetical protein